LETEIDVLFLSFDLCIHYCYDKDKTKIKNSTIGKWSYDCGKMNGHNSKMHKCSDLLKQIQKVEEIVKNVLHLSTFQTPIIYKPFYK